MFVHCMLSVQHLLKCEARCKDGTLAYDIAFDHMLDITVGSSKLISAMIENGVVIFSACIIEKMRAFV